MKKYIVFAAAAAFVALSSCVKDKEKDFADDQVSFSAQTGTIETRTTYGAESEEIQVDGKYVQYVDWVTGDEITIVSSAGGSDDYTITLNHVGSDDPTKGISKANVSPNGYGIAWGTGEQTFYAMYPAADSDLGSSLSTTDGMTCVIPPTWTPANAIELGQLPYGYMFAKTGPISRTTNVSLTFNPKFSAFCFTLTNSSTTESITLSSLKLESGSKAMSGSYSVSTSGTPGNFPSYSDGSSNVAANNSVTVNFSSLPGDGNTITSGLTIPASGSATFSVVTLPQVFNDLTVSVTKSGGRTKRLKLGKNTTPNDPTTYAPITFAAGKKHNISVTLPTFATYTYDFEVIDPIDLVYNGGTSNTAKVISWKNSGNGQQAADWHVEGYYSTEANALAADHTDTYYSTGYNAGSLLSSAITMPSGTGTEKTVPISYSSATASGTAPTVSDINAEIRNSGFGKGSSTDCYYNLSNPSDMTSDAIVESANCYIVNGPGYYRIPLVMGNAVKNNVINTHASSYTGTSGTTTTLFKNYNNDNVTSDNVCLGQPGSAYIVWEDVDGLVEATSYILPQTTFPISTTDDGKTVYWLQFHIPEGTIEQGNAVIAVTTGASGAGNVMWSYHIWVTNYVPRNYPGYSGADITFTGKNVSNTYNSTQLVFELMPLNLGFVQRHFSTDHYKYPEAKVYVRLEQDDSGSFDVMEVRRPEHVNVAKYNEGDAPFYQWGRKDPMNPMTYTLTYSSSSDSFKTTYGKDSFSHETTSNDDLKTIQSTINNPRIHYYWPSNSTSPSTIWGTTGANLWSADCSNNLYGSGSSKTGSPVVYKTIYDPSPVGYSVPAYCVFYAGTSSVTFTGATISNYKFTQYPRFSFTSNSLTLPPTGVVAASGQSASYVLSQGYYWMAVPSTSASGAYIAKTGSGLNVLSQGYWFTTGAAVHPMQNDN